MRWCEKFLLIGFKCIGMNHNFFLNKKYKKRFRSNVTFFVLNYHMDC